MTNEGEEAEGHQAKNGVDDKRNDVDDEDRQQGGHQAENGVDDEDSETGKRHQQGDCRRCRTKRSELRRPCHRKASRRRRTA